jgi:hypothetical protein
MHSYGRWPDKYFNQLEEAGEFIGEWLRKWTRMSVVQTKEKFGTLRVYCSFGWYSIYALWRPGYMWTPKWWPYKLDRLMSSILLHLLNIIGIPIQKSLYRWRYKKAVQKWPHLREEILCCADWRELLEDL